MKQHFKKHFAMYGLIVMLIILGFEIVKLGEQVEFIQSNPCEACLEKGGNPPYCLPVNLAVHGDSPLPGIQTGENT